MDRVFQISTLATFILQSKDCSILLRNGVREPLTHACTDLKSSKEICNNNNNNNNNNNSN